MNESYKTTETTTNVYA